MTDIKITPSPHGRWEYISAGGMALTAEQVEDVRAAREELRGYRNFTGYGRSHVNRLIAAVDALFPATEPAEVNGNLSEIPNSSPAPAEPAEERRSFPTIQDVPNNTLFHTHGGNGSSLFVRTHSGDLRLCLNAGREWSKLMQEEDFLPSSGPYVEVPWSKFPQPPADPFAQPAPAEPTEEETKAEECAVRLCVLPARHYGVHADRRGLRWNYPTSSPVVPAPTETGPWETCGHVPIGIVFRSKDRHPDFTWVNEGGSLLSVRNECEDGHFSDGEHCLPSMVDENFAPFVAAVEKP